MPRYNRVQHYSLGRPYFDIEVIPEVLPYQYLRYDTNSSSFGQIQYNGYYENLGNITLSGSPRVFNCEGDYILYRNMINQEKYIGYNVGTDDIRLFSTSGWDGNCGTSASVLFVSSNIINPMIIDNNIYPAPGPITNGYITYLFFDAPVIPPTSPYIQGFTTDFSNFSSSPSQSDITGWTGNYEFLNYGALDGSVFKCEGDFVGFTNWRSTTDPTKYILAAGSSYRLIDSSSGFAGVCDETIIVDDIWIVDIPRVMYNYYFYPEEGTHTSGTGIDYTITYT